MAHLCATGEHVDARTYAHMTHALIALAAMPAVLSFFRDVLAGHLTATTCR